MTKEKITIQSISIRLATKSFEYGYDLKNKEKADSGIKEFKKNHYVVREEKKNDWSKTTTLYYYTGNIEFEPVKEKGSSLKMDIRLPIDAIKSVATMCLDNVCDICEKQTRAFQNTFVDYVKENSGALTTQNEKIKESLISRGINKVLKIKGE